MAQYTIEDIEILRQKSGISYEEAVNLLEYHNGSLARALVDLEKNGRIKDAKPKASATTSTHRGARGLNYLYRLRLKVCKGDIVICNLSSLFVLFVVLVAPWVAVISLILTLVLGYRTSIERDCADFSRDNLEDIVRNAGNNVRQTVSGIARDLGGQQKTEDSGKSFYEQKPEQRTESAPSGTTPVNVQFSEDGSVNVSEDADGYHEADIQ